MGVIKAANSLTLLHVVVDWSGWWQVKKGTLNAIYCARSPTFPATMKWTFDPEQQVHFSLPGRMEPYALRTFHPSTSPRVQAPVPGRRAESVLLIPHMLRHTLRLLLSWVRLTLRAQCARRSTGLGGHAWNVDQWERRLRVLKRNEATRERCTTVPAFDPAASQLLRQQLLRSVGRTNNRPAPEPTAKRCFGTTCTFTLFCVYQKWQTR